MARRLRYIPPGGALVEITCRTIQGRLLLRPSPVLKDITLGVLARAARLASILVHAYAFLPNHYHLLVRVADAQQLAEFMNYLNSNLAREAGRLARWREKFWGRRYQAVLVSDEEEAQVGRLSYVLSQGVKEGLVASPFDWPGVHCARALCEGATVSGRWQDRRSNPGHGARVFRSIHKPSSSERSSASLRSLAGSRSRRRSIEPESWA